MLKRLLSGFILTVMAVSSGHAAEVALAPQISDARGVKVTVTPRNLADTAKTWDFDVVLETHARDLGDDMAKSSALVVEGKQHMPVSWEGAPPGGHHRKGNLRFKALAPRPTSVQLQIRLAGESAARNFSWALSGK